MVSTIGVMEGPNPDRDLTPSNDETTECDPRDQVQLIFWDRSSIYRTPWLAKAPAGRSRKITKGETEKEQIRNGMKGRQGIREQGIETLRG